MTGFQSSFFLFVSYFLKNIFAYLVGFKSVGDDRSGNERYHKQREEYDHQNCPETNGIAISDNVVDFSCLEDSRIRKLRRYLLHDFRNEFYVL